MLRDSQIDRQTDSTDGQTDGLPELNNMLRNQESYAFPRHLSCRAHGVLGTTRYIMHIFIYVNTVVWFVGCVQACLQLRAIAKKAI